MAYKYSHLNINTLQITFKVIVDIAAVSNWREFGGETGLYVNLTKYCAESGWSSKINEAASFFRK